MSMKWTIVALCMTFGCTVGAQTRTPLSRLGVNATETALALVATETPGRGETYNAWLSRKDHALANLARQTPPIPNLTARLVEIAGSPSCEAVSRQYIMQYLQLDVLPKVSISERQLIRQFVRSFLGRRNDETAGTALLLSRLDQEVPSEDIETFAINLLVDEHAAPKSRAIAVGVLSATQPELARSLAADHRTDSALVGAAVRLMDARHNESSMTPCGGRQP